MTTDCPHERSGRSERGSVLVMVAVFLPVLLLFGALAVDVARWYVHKDHLQNQADAAVLAGADEFLKDLEHCDPNAIKAQAAKYVNKNPITPVDQAGTVSIQSTVQCPGTFDAEGKSSYVDVTVTNTDVGALFSKIGPDKIVAHARASLFQATELGGSDVMPFAIEQANASDDKGLVQIQVNAPKEPPYVQSLVCDGTAEPATKALANVKIHELMNSGCPTAQINGPGPCPSTPSSPPSCLWRFTQMDEGAGFDDAFEKRFQNDTRSPCTHPIPVPKNNWPVPPFVPGDPRAIIIYVVPNGSFKDDDSRLVPILDFATFYWEGWDHDPCIKKGEDPDPPDPDHIHGSVWGHYVADAEPSTGGSSGTIPCVPGSSAASNTCVIQLTQ
jgi:hypothetical protein